MPAPADEVFSVVSVPSVVNLLCSRRQVTCVMQGGSCQENTHDIAAEWVLGHQFVRIHEVSREKNAQGQPDYEAMAFVGWDQPTGDYVCAWLDTYGGMTPATFGRGKRDGDEIHFLFKDKDSVFHTRFIYHKESGTWEWRMDSEEKGTTKPFLRAKLTKK